MTKPDEPEGLIERAARHVLDNSRKGNASLNEHQRAADDEKLMTSYRDIIGKALSFIAAHPVADAGGVTDADREAAAKCVEHGLSRPNPLNVRQGVVDSWHLIQAFARHRLQSVAAATAAKDAEIAELAEAVRCIMARCEALEDEAYNGIATVSANGRDETHEAGFWRGQKSTAKSIRAHLHDMTRAALSEAREAGG